MALTQQDREDVAEMIRAAMAANPGSARCTAQYPHEGKLRWIKGPDFYICECGQQYIKGGKGTLIERPEAMRALQGGV